MVAVPDVVAAKARSGGADAWLAGLDDLVGTIAEDWGLALGAPYTAATEAYVIRAERSDGTPAVLKLPIPVDLEAVRREIAVLRLTGGRGCPQLLDADLQRGAFLMERLGPAMCDLDIPLSERQRVLCDAASALWRPAPEDDLPTGAEIAARLADSIRAMYAETPGACTRSAVDQALACARRRWSAHDPSRAVLVHGDVHQWNALAADPGFKLVDPDGVLAEPEFDLGALMREDPVELAEGGDRDRAERLAELTGLDPQATWEWGVVARVQTGLLGRRIGLQPVAGQMLAVADRIAAAA